MIHIGLHVLSGSPGIRNARVRLGMIFFAGIVLLASTTSAPFDRSEPRSEATGSSPGGRASIIRAGDIYPGGRRLLAAALTFSEQAKITAPETGVGFGETVSVSGDYALIGAYADDDNGAASGSVYVFQRSGQTWSQVGKLTASDASSSMNFGCCISQSGDYALIGACGGGPYPGKAYVFLRSGSTYT